MKLKKIPIIISIIIFIIIAWVIVSNNTKNSSFQQKKTFIVKRKTLYDTLSLSAKIDAKEKASVSFGMGGRLTWIGVKEGQEIKRFEGIASLDQREMQKKLEQSLNSFMIARRDFDQSKDDYGDYSHLQPTRELRDKFMRLFDKNQQNLDNSIINVELQALAKEYALLSSPIDGTVTSLKNIYPNMTVGAGQTIADIINPDTIFISALADQAEVVKLSNGMKAKITLDAFPNKNFEGEINAISLVPQAGESSTAYEVSINFPKEKNIKIGMTGDISFIVDTFSNIIAVPYEYIEIDKNNKSFVYILKSNKLEKVPVTTGNDYDGYVIVQSGLKENETLSEVVYQMQ